MFRQFFYIPKSDRRVLLAVMAVMAVAIGVIHLAGGKEEQAPLATPPDSAGLADPMPASPSAQPYYQQPAPKAERFTFDPNTADSTALLRLGLQPWQVRNIYKYRAHGGIYRSKEDFARLYGLTVKQYRELEPYIRISADYLPASTLLERRRNTAYDHGADTTLTATDRAAGSHPRKLADGETIDLATADTAALQRIPGIGSFFARRIADYGRRLGGYVSLDQLNEIEDFPQEALHYLTLDNPSAQRLNINTLSVNELKRHPYINFYQARAIADFRRQHGAIEDLSDLRLLPDFPPEAIDRLRPYVDY